MTDTVIPTVTPVSDYEAPPHEQHWIDRAHELAAGFALTAADYDESATLPIPNLTALTEAGFDTMLLPEELGGGGASYRTFGEVLAIITRACPSTGCIWLMHVGAASTLITLGTPEMASFFSAELAAGKRFANALSEPTSGNLFLMPLQQAQPVEGGWALHGAKRFVSGCEIADYYLVNALVDGIPNFFAVARDDSVSFVPIWDTMGMRATRSQLMSLDGTLLRADWRCRPPGPTDANPIGTGLPWMSVGIAEAALAALSDHALHRMIPTTGAPLAAMQWVQFEVAEATVRLEAARLLAQRTMWKADTQDPTALSSAIKAKLFANQTAKDIAELGVRIGGASGYLKTSPIQRHFRDAQAGALMAYSVELCRDYVGKEALGMNESAGGFG
jgi:alkylation response protein AidB-like acyl-CoA dehydrogenase